jgi:hypothetical protein
MSIALAPTHAGAAETRTFEAQDGSYTFEYPLGFALDHLFADGTGDVVGVKASTPANGDVIIAFLGPFNAGDTREVSERTRQSITDEFTKVVADRPSIKLKSSTLTTLLGLPAVDMVFRNGRSPFSKDHLQIQRYIFTVVGDKAYNLKCIYLEEKAAQFAPACDQVMSTVKLHDANARKRTSGGDAAAGACTRLQLNERVLAATELASNLMLKDQSPAAIERSKKSYAAMKAIDERAGANPSAKDCRDADATSSAAACRWNARMYWWRCQ